jgi:hypothetical protein
MALSGGAIAGGLASGLSGLAGVVAQKKKDKNQTDGWQAAANAMLPGTDAQIANDPAMAALPDKAIQANQFKGLDIDSSLNQADANHNAFMDASHPAWGILNNLTGNPGNAPLPGGGGPSPIPSGAQMGAAIPTNNAGMVNGPISVDAQNQMTAPQQLQNGGVVRANYGRRTIAPSFERGPVLPTGPNNTVTGPASPTMQGMAGYADGGVVGDTAMGQGITPAGTAGIEGFDAGGVVSQGFMPPAGNINVPMTGAAAGLVQGMQAGQSIGYNLHQMYLENHNRQANAEYAGALTGVDVNNPNSGSAPDESHEGILGKAKDAVESFFQHMHGTTLDDNHKPNGAQAIPAASDSTPSVASQGVAVPPNGPSPTSAASGPGTASAPSPIPAPSGGTSTGAPANAAAPQPGAGPSQSQSPGQGGSAPVSQQAQATSVASKTVASDPNVRAGIPSKTPEQSDLPHSMTPDQWQHMNLLKQKAVMAAARAGEDPAKVYESLTAMQNAHFQGQILKQLGTANTAFQNGDMKSVEQALKNVNYYLPNGSDIQFKKADANDMAKDPTVKAGDLMYKNPFFGMYGHENDPEYTKVDSQHIQSLGAAALDPRTVQEAQLKSYSAQQEAQTNRIKAQGEFMTGQGRQLTGAASYGKMNLAQQSQDVDRRLKIAAGNKDQAEANWYNTRQPTGSNTGQPKITLASLRSLQNDAATYTDRIVQGQPTTSPVMVSDGSGGTTPNLSPGAGRAIPDASRIPAWATNGVGKDGKPVPLTPEQQENVKVLGGQINSANAGLPGMNTPKAVELAARITHYQSHPTTHTDPATGKPAKDFVYDRDNGTAHVWVGNAYENVYLKPNVADESGAGGGPEAPPPGGNSAPGSGGGENEGPDAFQ